MGYTKRSKRGEKPCQLRLRCNRAIVRRIYVATNTSSPEPLVNNLRSITFLVVIQYGCTDSRCAS
jgi:hypothetical protein